MVAECLLFGTGAAIAKDAVTIEYLKSKQLELSEQEKQEIVSDNDRRFIHFTSEDSAKKIMKAGFLIPTKGILANHFTKSIDNKGKKKDTDMVYMFDSKTFSVDDYIRNLPKKRSPFNGCYEYYAVSTKPNEYDLNDFKRRAQDGAITYEGRLDIDGTDTKLVKYVLGLDDEGKYEFVEKPMDFKYTPPQELLDKLQKDKMGNLRYALTTYMSEVRKSRQSLKQFKVQKEEYKEQQRKKKEFVKANKQFKEEEKEKSYIFEKDGRKIVVKNVEYEQIGGKKLQKLAIIENDENNKRKKLKDCTNLCYMDEFNIEDMSNEVATEYFFGNLDRINETQSKEPAYIGLPIENLETGEISNEYDEAFKKYMDNRQKNKEILDIKYDEYNKSKKLTYKVKEMFSKLIGNKNEVKMLNGANEQIMYDAEDKETLANLGYSSVEAMNKDDKEAEMFSFLAGNTNSIEEIASYDINSNEDKNRNYNERTLEDI